MSLDSDTLFLTCRAGVPRIVSQTKNRQASDMAFRVYNTLSGELEEFKPLQEGRVGMYTCGPTVYDFPHIGNYRTFVFQDILRRWLKYRGYTLRHVMNLDGRGRQHHPQIESRRPVRCATTRTKYIEPLSRRIATSSASRTRK